MKTFLNTFLLLSLSCRMVYAQNSVSVSQKGNGNKVAVTQSKNNTLTTSNSAVDCKKTNKDINPDRNTILIKRLKDKQGDILINATSTGHNKVLKILNKQGITASQDGKANGLYMILPDTEKTFKKLTSTQNGTQNRISARLNNPIHSIAISQKGNENNIAINPCIGQNFHANPKIKTNVEQKGEGNSIAIIQN